MTDKKPLPDFTAPPSPMVGPFATQRAAQVVRESGLSGLAERAIADANAFYEEHKDTLNTAPPESEAAASRRMLDLSARLRKEAFHTPYMLEQMKHGVGYTVILTHARASGGSHVGSQLAMNTEKKELAVHLAGMLLQDDRLFELFQEALLTLLLRRGVGDPL